MCHTVNQAMSDSTKSDAWLVGYLTATIEATCYDLRRPGHGSAAARKRALDRLQDALEMLRDEGRDVDLGAMRGGGSR